MKTEIFQIAGMSCANCVSHVTGAIQALPGTSNVKVDLESGTAVVDVDEDHVTVEQIMTAIDDEGYSAKVRLPS